ncbi:MAG TPA: hypothetical protein VIA62_15360 [Thermoanaerobaculia bacterium]|jgi:hypothetical protein|nr:hypothetical protein [Thermoanaerobaculia bacterium]
MADIQPPGKIITFYSYKGGTGRSMALANVGYLLAETLPEGSRGVLMIDWDLEAPGLHCYFDDSLTKAAKTAQRAGIRSLAQHPGLIDFFESADSGYDKENVDESRARALASLPAHVLATDFDNLHILKAGRFDDAYPERIRKFDWERFHGQDPGFFREFRHVLMARYDYVLIDSRTGLTDTSGICVQQMPEKLVLVFIPNHQNVDGVLDVARRVKRFRVGSSDLRPLVSFPLASRIDGTNERLRVTWRNGGKLDGEEIAGYQKAFEDLFEDLYELDECDLRAYFDATQIQHDSDYAYGEKIAARRGTTDRLSLGYAFANFTRRLTTLSVPWEPLPEEQEIETAKRRELAASAREEKATSKVRLLSVISVVIALLGLIVGLLSLRGYGKSQAQAVLAAARATSDPLEQALLLTELKGSSEPAGGVELARQVALTRIPTLALRGHTDSVLGVAFSPDGSRIATASADGTARIWNADGTGEPLVLRGHSDPFKTVVWSPLSKDLLVASDFGVQLWNPRTGRSIGTALSEDSEKQRVITTAFNPDGQILVVDHSALHILGAKAAMQIVQFPNPILNARFGWSGKLLATSSPDRIRVWNLDGGARLSVRLSEPADSLAISPDGRYLVTATKDATNLWRLPQGTLLNSDHSGTVEAIEFSPDGRLLALAGPDGTTRVYNTLGSDFLARAIAVLQGHAGAVRSVAFSPDGKLLATASDDKTVRLWNLPARPAPGSYLDWKGLLDYIREGTKVCLTAEQRSRLLSEKPEEAQLNYTACEVLYRQGPMNRDPPRP